VNPGSESGTGTGIQEVPDNPGYRPSPVRHNTGFM
jgi:hypothetical protein